MGVLIQGAAHEIKIKRTADRIKREDCAAIGHHFGKEFAAMGGIHRACTNCGYQEHFHEGRWK